MHHLLHVNFHMQAYVMTIPQDTVRGGCNTTYCPQVLDVLMGVKAAYAGKCICC